MAEAEPGEDALNGTSWHGSRATEATEAVAHSPASRPIGRQTPAPCVALFLKSLEGHGLQRGMINLANALLSRGIRVDLLIPGRLRGASLERIARGVRLVRLSPDFRLRRPLAVLGEHLAADAGRRTPTLPMVTSRSSYYVAALARYLESGRADGLISGGTLYNLAALWARRVAATGTPIVISEHNNLPARLVATDKRLQWHWHHVPGFVRSIYPWADRIVSVSDRVGDDLAAVSGLPRNSISTVYNPVFAEELRRRADAPLDHPWFQPGQPPVILGVGRLRPQKDFPTLIRAFARVRAAQPARLVILGDEPERGARTRLLQLARQLGVEADLELPGYVPNPFAYMARARLFVLSSRHEGMPNVLIEAMACGCPVVATDCGVSEVLGSGSALIAPGDQEALAHRIIDTLSCATDGEGLRGRAMTFSPERVAAQYLDLLNLQ